MTADRVPVTPTQPDQSQRVRGGIRALSKTANPLNARLLWKSLPSVALEWNRNHRHHGGLRAALRCLFGAVQICVGPPRQCARFPGCEIVTFSVVPVLTAVWAKCINYATQNTESRLIVGDCSGGFEIAGGPDSLQRHCVANFSHGEKLDLFLRTFCGSDYVLICDDDILWLDGKPLEWTLDAMHRDPRVAAVSLVPRPGLIPLMAGVTDVAMGSYCLLVRRRIWQPEQLSFQVVSPTGSLQCPNFYETADFANVELIRRGYKVAVAPEDVRRYLLPSYGVSCWAIRIQRTGGHLLPRLLKQRGLQPKVYAIVCFMEGVAALARELRLHLCTHDLVPPQMLLRAKHELSGLMDAKEREHIALRVASDLDRVRALLAQSMRLVRC